MEKFTDWRDKGTGIAPFLPPTVKEPTIVAQICYLFLLVSKCLFLLPLILTYCLIGSNSILNIILSFILSWKSEVTVQGVKRRDIDPSKHYPQKNNLYICNCSSPLDGLALSLISKDKCNFLVPDGSIIYKMDLKQITNFILDGSLSAKKYGQEINDFNKLKNTALFMFPEGTCSNGKSVLPFNFSQDVFTEMIESVEYLNIKIIQLKVNNSLVTPLGVSSGFKYLIRVISKGVNIKYKINNDNIKPSLEIIRIALNDGDKYKLVSKSLNIVSKGKFTDEFKFYRRK